MCLSRISPLGGRFVVVLKEDETSLVVPNTCIELAEVPIQQPWHGCLVLRHPECSKAFNALLSTKLVHGLTLRGQPATVQDVFNLFGQHPPVLGGATDGTRHADTISTLV
jgi:hypothetical protein